MRGPSIWRSVEHLAPSLPPFCKGSSKHRSPVVQFHPAAADDDGEYMAEVDQETAASYGRTRIGDDIEQWPRITFEVADSNRSSYLCPAEWAAMADFLMKNLGSNSAQRLRECDSGFDFTSVDMDLEGRISYREFLVWSKKLVDVFGLQRCVRAATRYIGLRDAEAIIRKTHKTCEIFEGYNGEASLTLLRVCAKTNGKLLDSVRRALAAKADPNTRLMDATYNGYTPLIFLAMTAPTANGSQATQAIESLIEAKADPFRESGAMPFGKWSPLRFASFMQNDMILNSMLKYSDQDRLIGNRFLWAAGENVDYVMLEELAAEFGNELVDKVLALSRYSVRATVLLQQYASSIAAGNLTPAGVKQLVAGEFQSGSLPVGEKADPNVPGVEGRTALMDVAARGHLETVKALLEARAELDIRDSYGATALHHAAVHLHVGCVEALLDAKANPAQVDQAQFSPWMLVGEETAHKQDQVSGLWSVRTDGKVGNLEARRQLLQMLKPPISPEEFIAKLSEDWTQVVDPDFAGPKITLEALEDRFRLHESLFFNEKLADGHGSHEGRRERHELINPIAKILMELLAIDHLEGDKKVLTRYLLLATRGPSGLKNCAHVHSRWPTFDNRGAYRAPLTKCATAQLAKYAAECNALRKVINETADEDPDSACAGLVNLPADVCELPQAWLDDSHPDAECMRAVQKEQMLRFDPPWALDVNESPTRACLWLLRLGACQDLGECADLQQVDHASMAELFARGYIRYSNLCNKRFQEAMTRVAKRVAEREGLNMDPPAKTVPAKKLPRLMEKIREKKDDLKDFSSWPGRSKKYFNCSQAFCILDTVRLNFTCNGDTLQEQVATSMHIFNEFAKCTVEKDGICVLRKKNGFARGVKGAGGYADVKLLVYADLGVHDKLAFDGTEIPLQIVGEVQLILDDYMKVKHKMHLVYEVDRGSFDHSKRDGEDEK